MAQDDAKMAPRWSRDGFDSIDGAKRAPRESKAEAIQPKTGQSSV